MPYFANGLRKVGLGSILQSKYSMSPVTSQVLKLLLTGALYPDYKDGLLSNSNLVKMFIN